MEPIRRVAGHFYDLTVGIDSATYIDRDGEVFFMYTPEGRVRVGYYHRSLERLYGRLKAQPELRVVPHAYFCVPNGERSEDEMSGVSDEIQAKLQKVKDWLGMTNTLM